LLTDFVTVKTVWTQVLTAQHSKCLAYIRGIVPSKSCNWKSFYQNSVRNSTFIPYILSKFLYRKISKLRSRNSDTPFSIRISISKWDGWAFGFLFSLIIEGLKVCKQKGMLLSQQEVLSADSLCLTSATSGYTFDYLFGSGLQGDKESIWILESLWFLINEISLLLDDGSLSFM
jgi:hypothetical protein